MDKKNLREKIISKRDYMVSDEKTKKDDSIKHSLMNMKDYCKCKKIFIYIGFGSEINTLKFITEFLKEGKEVYVPKVYKDTKEIKAIEISSLEGLYPSSYGILEPINDNEIENKEDIDLVVVPGVAFDRDGGRVGYGGGYYDKYLATLNKDVPKIALAYDFQVVNEVPTEGHDINIDCIITDKEVIFI